MKTALETAARNALYKTASGSWAVDTGQFCRLFKEAWLYSNQDIPAGHFDSTSGSFTLLFQKNLGVTNASLLELASLIRCHAKSDVGAPVSAEFYSDQQYTWFLGHLWESTAPGNAQPDRQKAEECIAKVATEFAAKYGMIVASTIIMDPYYTSVIIHVPKSLRLDLLSVVAEAGYVHSFGVALYSRNIQKAKRREIVARLRRFLDKEAGRPVFITPYADEFFSPWENKSPVSIRNGLDGVRLQMRKHYVDGKPLIAFLASLPQELSNRVIVPQGFESYVKEREDSVRDGSASHCTLWFITDSRIERPAAGGFVQATDDVYLIAYAQYLMNDNQFIAFKERKPGWYASVTLPHTLSTACINIARLELRSNQPIILDPFCGTGTTLIDAALRIPNAVVIGLDREPLCERVIKDNLEFFSLGVNEVSDIIDQIEPLISNLKSGTPPEVSRPTDLARLSHGGVRGETWRTQFQYALELVEREITGGTTHLQDISPELTVQGIHRIVDGVNFSHAFLDALRCEDNPLSFRILVYLVWRGLALGTFAMRGRKADFFRVLAAEFEKAMGEFKYLRNILVRMRGEPKGSGAFCSPIGLYSRASSVHPERIGELRSGLRVHSQKALSDVLSRAPQSGLHFVPVSDSIACVEKLERAVDAIVTDPPYGFNAAEGGSEELRDLFGRMVPAFIGALRKGGQLIMILPAFARNGRQIPFFETQDLLVRQIISAASGAGRSCSNPVRTHPGDRSLFEFPLYWNSASVLERKILRFIID